MAAIPFPTDNLEGRIDQDSENPDPTLSDYFHAFFSENNLWLMDILDEKNYQQKFIDHTRNNLKAFDEGRRYEAVEKAAIIKEATPEVTLGYLEQYALLDNSSEDVVALTMLIDDVDFVERAGKMIKDANSRYGIEFDPEDRPENISDAMADREKWNYMGNHLAMCFRCSYVLETLQSMERMGSPPLKDLEPRIKQEQMRIANMDSEERKPLMRQYYGKELTAPFQILAISEYIRTLRS